MTFKVHTLISNPRGLWVFYSFMPNNANTQQVPENVLNEGQWRLAIGKFLLFFNIKCYLIVLHAT